MGISFPLAWWRYCFHLYCLEVWRHSALDSLYMTCSPPPLLLQWYIISWLWAWVLVCSHPLFYVHCRPIQFGNIGFYVLGLLKKILVMVFFHFFNSFFLEFCYFQFGYPGMVLQFTYIFYARLISLSFSILFFIWNPLI